MLYIVAGSRKQAMDYVANNGITQPWRYVFDAPSAAWVESGATVLKVGTWHNNPELGRINAVLSTKNCSVETT